MLNSDAAAFDFLAKSVVEGRKGKPFPSRECPEPHTVLIESLAHGASCTQISLVILTSKNRAENRLYCLRSVRALFCITAGIIFSRNRVSFGLYGK